MTVIVKKSCDSKMDLQTKFFTLSIHCLSIFFPTKLNYFGMFLNAV